jgi:hypothetical protein
MNIFSKKPCPKTEAEAAKEPLFRPEDLALLREVQELARKYGYRANGGELKVDAPIRLENGGTMALFSMKLEIHRWGVDPFKET